MSVTRHSHWFSGQNRHEEFKQVLNRFFNQDETDSSNVVTSQWLPRVDIKEEEKRFVILADIPGVDPNNIEINMDKGVLSIKGDRAAETQNEGEKFTRVERSRGTFYRRFALPDSANAEDITATGKLGVLEIVIPKHPESTPRRITISH